MPLDPPHPDELRGMVRAVLREALAGRSPEPVSIGNDADLAGFVRMLIARLDDPSTAVAIRKGSYRFALDPSRPLPPAGEEGTHRRRRWGGEGESTHAARTLTFPVAPQRGPLLSRERERTPGDELSSRAVHGVITERRIGEFANAGTIVLAPGAILTPLARDRARRLGLKIERSR